MTQKDKPLLIFKYNHTNTGPSKINNMTVHKASEYCPTCGQKPEPIVLSPRQREIYEFIDGWIILYGSSPTWQETSDGLNLKTKDQAFNLAKPLFKRGILGKTDNGRSIVVLKQIGEAND